MRLANNKYEIIKQMIIQLFIQHDIRSIPIDCFEICAKMDIKLKPYSRLTKEALSKAMATSKDGFCLLLEEPIGQFSYNQWYIFYNDHQSHERIRFTLMHEIGHIVLDHTEHSELAESEANFFAKYALAPPPLIHKIQPEDYMDVAKRFDLSQECAYYSMQFYTKWLHLGSPNYQNYELVLLSQFEKAV